LDIEWLTPEEAGIIWGLKARRVQAMCSKGIIPSAVRKGRIDGRTKEAKKSKKSKA
jgi:hypothetical protein